MGRTYVCIYAEFGCFEGSIPWVLKCPSVWGADKEQFTPVTSLVATILYPENFFYTSCERRLHIFFLGNWHINWHEFVLEQNA